MDADTVFNLVAYLAIAAWILLIALPRHAFTQNLVHALWIPCLLALVYIWALFIGEPHNDGSGARSLQAVATLFESRKAVLAAWVQIVLFALFVGAWQVRDSQSKGINHWLVIPCLVTTGIAGPIGLAMYLILRALICRELTLKIQTRG